MGVTHKPATFRDQYNIEVSFYLGLLKLQTHTQSKKNHTRSLASNILSILGQHNH